MTNLSIKIGDADKDGVCLAKVYESDRHIMSFETTQAEVKVITLQLAGYHPSADMIEAADAAEARRIDLGRTLAEDIVTIAEFHFTIPAHEVGDAR